ncbi:uncharacterized protein prrt4b isoform X2 [Trichomycterus rosablanca]|uniref:uncharacterized protein prrt4b isoform X2 n=1 Tax=Trichomycterus rosablanca TaxID=2290929 RepID=UPI002F35E72D
MPEVKFSVPSLKLPWSLSAKAQGDLTVENSTTESPYTTRKEFIVSVKASTAYIYHTTTTQPQDILITSAQIVTSLPQRDIKRPKDELLRKQPQTDRPKPLPDLDPNYDLEFWPPNKASHTEKHPLTAPPTRSTQETPRTTRSYKETTTVTVQNSETKMTEKVTITSTALQSKPSSTPVSMTTLPRLMPSIEKTTVFTSPREDTTQLQNVISTVFMGSTEKALAKTPVTAAGTTVGDFYGIQQTTQAPSKAGGRRMEIPNLLHTPLTTASSVEGLTEEEEHTNTNVYIDLTAKGKDREEYTTITITTLQSTGMPTTEDWPDMTQESPLPDCNAEYSEVCNSKSQDWERAAAAVFLAAIFSLACGGLQLFAMLHAVGLAGRPEVFQPWPWWAFQLSCRVCEAIVCLTLALVVSQPIYCSDHLPLPSSCWMELLATKSPIIPGSYQWTLNQQEKLAICDPVGHGETECLPLYTLVDDRMGSLNGLDLLYHSNRALAYRDLDLHLPEILPNTSALSVGSSCPSDSTADLQPPSPINLSRSIDEALFSESLFPVSLFSPIRPLTSSEHSLDGKDKALGSAQTLKDTHPSDPGLYRTSSCVEMPPQASLTALDQKNATFSPCPSMTSSCCSSPEHWRGSSSSCSLYRPSVAGSSLLLCSSPEEHNPLPSTTSAISVSTDATGADSVNQQRHSRTQSTQESLELPPVLDQSVQEEFLSVCRQIDTVSICSETIDL